MRESQFLVAMEQEGWVWEDSFREAKMKADFEYAELVEMEWLNCFQALVKKIHQYYLLIMKNIFLLQMRLILW